MSGIGAVVKTGSPGRVVKDETYLLCSFDGMALAPDRFPTSFGAALAEFGKRIREAAADPAKAKSLDGKALARVGKDLRPWIEVPDAAAFHQIWKLCQELKIVPVVIATGDLSEVAREIAQAKIPVVVRSLTFDSTPIERRFPADLAKAGVEIAFASGGTGGKRLGDRPARRRGARGGERPRPKCGIRRDHHESGQVARDRGAGGRRRGGARRRSGGLVGRSHESRVGRARRLRRRGAGRGEGEAMSGRGAVGSVDLLSLGFLSLGFVSLVSASLVSPRRRRLPRRRTRRRNRSPPPSPPHMW